MQRNDRLRDPGRYPQRSVPVPILEMRNERPRSHHPIGDDPRPDRALVQVNDHGRRSRPYPASFTDRTASARSVRGGIVEHGEQIRQVRRTGASRAVLHEPLLPERSGKGIIGQHQKHRVFGDL